MLKLPLGPRSSDQSLSCHLIALRSIWIAVSTYFISKYLADFTHGRFDWCMRQAVLPGLTTALTGINYAPCLFSTGAVGAIGGVTGIGISPKIFNYGA